ncbi:MAG: polyprenyl synthetase family protein, partial [Candidatus Omnitrophica bacterium]|nr:polyprenyl synthetase family protein [Candidatus Omnitrophota bacterium]
KVGKKEIFRIYDYKTAFYTFAAPLSMGATLAGASQNEIKKLRDYGLYLGRAFQIKDDILGIFGNEKQIGKPNLSDLQEEKKTILIWQAYHNSNKTVKKQISDTFSKQQVTRKDLSIIKKIIIDSGSLDYCKKTITDLIKSAKSVINDSTMPPTYKKHLYGYCDKILDI